MKKVKALYVLTPENFFDIDDTVAGCDEMNRNTFNYVQGWTGPNFPVPAIPLEIGYHPAHWSQPYPSAYIWITDGRTYCRSFWEKWNNSTYETR